MACDRLFILLAISDWYNTNFPHKRCALCKDGTWLLQGNCFRLQQKQQNNRSKIIPDKYCTDIQQDFMSCAIRFVFHLLTGAFQSGVGRMKHTQAAGSHSQKCSLHPGKKGLLHCEREPPVVFQLAFSGQLKAKITLPLCFQYCDLMAKWIFSTKHNFLLWFRSSLNGKAALMY